MDIEQCKERISRYFQKPGNQPKFVNVNSQQHLRTLKSFLKTSANRLLTTRDFCKDDEDPCIEILFSVIRENKIPQNIILTEIPSYLKLKGGEALKKFFREIRFSHTVKTIVLCYQCEDILYELERSDPRWKDDIYYIDDEYTPLPKIVFLRRDQTHVKKCSNLIVGIHNLADALERLQDIDRLYVETKKEVQLYKNSIYVLSEEKDPYANIIYNMGITDNQTLLSREDGSDEYWRYAERKLAVFKNWHTLFHAELGDVNNMETILGKYETFSPQQKWFVFLALKQTGASCSNLCLKKISQTIEHGDDVIEAIYTSIVEETPESDTYWKFYDDRKKILLSITRHSHVNDRILKNFCALLNNNAKKADSIYYLTDLTQLEQEKILEYLVEYGNEDNYTKMKDVLEHIFPDVYNYLNPFNYEKLSEWKDPNGLFKNYFKKYTYQKIINKLFPSFLEIVEDQAKKRLYNRYLSTRDALLRPLTNQQNFQIFFLDALGVEFLNFIEEECNTLNLKCHTAVCRSNLPTLTKYNTEFKTSFANRLRDIKKLDEIKHEPILSYSYEKKDSSIYLLRELQIIREVLEEIKNTLNHNEYEKVYLISDHGASRLAVIANKEPKWEMSAQGEHAGRCCPTTQGDMAPEAAIQDNGYWCLANYDRFKGGRKATTEIHGGATLEEIVVPFIEIELFDKTDLKVILNEKKITFNIKDKNAYITLYATKKLNHVSVKVNGQPYSAETEDCQNFRVRLPDLKEAGKYNVQVFTDNILIADRLSFDAEKEGMKIRKLF